MNEEANLFRKKIRDLFREEVKVLVEEVNYSSMVCNDKKEKFGYYIMEWIGVPWTDQETHTLMCDAVYWNSVPRAPFWYMHNSAC